MIFNMNYGTSINFKVLSINVNNEIGKLLYLAFIACFVFPGGL